MERQRAFKLALICSAAISLQGCIAAAFPIAAGGLMVGGAETDRSAPSDIAAAPTPSSSPTPETVGIVEVETSTPPPTPVSAQQTPNLVEQLIPVGPGETAPSAPGNAVRDEADFAGIEEAAETEEPPVEVSTETDRAEALLEVESTTGASAVTAPASEVERAAALVETEMPPAPAAVPEAPVSDGSNRTTLLVETDPARSVSTPLPSSSAIAAVAGARAGEMIDAPASATASNLARSSASSATEAVTSAPTTGGLVPVPSAPPATAGGTFFDPFVAYATTPSAPGSEARPSAMLSNAAALQPDRINCETGRPTVLIDLDPGTQSLFPVDYTSASPALAQKLADLRRQGIDVAWISRNSVEREADIRVALFRTGLDPLGEDKLLLIRSSDERKQLRREQLAETSCLIAIAGDERSDFHELYDYLLNPADAASLEPLIGEGWFLIPTPLLPERPE